MCIPACHAIAPATPYAPTEIPSLPLAFLSINRLIGRDSRANTNSVQTYLDFVARTRETLSRLPLLQVPKMVGSRSSNQLTATAWTTMFLVTFASFLCLCAAESPVAYKTIRVVNNCAFPVWPAIVGSTDLPPPRMSKVKAGESYSWKADPFWSGSIWGRTGCLFNPQGLGGCNSGDCGGNLQCKVESQDNIAITKAVFEFLGGIAKPDTFSVTLEKGYNLPMSVVPSYSANNVSSSRPCESMACTADANAVCPKELQMKKKGSVVTACNGHYDGYLPSSPAFSKAFQKACPRAFPFRSGTICPPSTASYTVTFCPRRPSL